MLGSQPESQQENNTELTMNDIAAIDASFQYWTNTRKESVDLELNNIKT